MSDGAIVQARGLKKRFGARTALAGLDLSIGKGQLYGMVGPNGAGKTTLIRIICGLLRPDEGAVTILGWRVPNVRVQSQIGYMPQEIALYSDLTVMQNLEFFGALYDLPSDQLRERAQELLEMVQLVEHHDQPVGTLSGGMQRRASLVTSMLHKPRLLLLDEPTAGIDPRLRGILWDHFSHLAEREDVTMLISTHLMEEADRCHVIGLLSDGRLLAEGRPTELLDRSGVRSIEEAFAAFETRQEAS